MNIYEKYRRQSSGLRTQTTRESAKEILKGIFDDPGKKLDSSITLPNWQAARLKHATKRLEKAGINAPQTTILSNVIHLAQRKVRRLQCQTERTKRRNTKEYTYKKISLQWRSEDYNTLHARADHAKISASYIIDLALRLYLRAAVAIALGELSVVVCLKKQNGNDIFQKKIRTASLKSLADTTGIYQRATLLSTPNRIKFAIELGPPTYPAPIRA